jgi:hypothetical protein
MGITESSLQNKSAIEVVSLYIISEMTFDKYFNADYYEGAFNKKIKFYLFLIGFACSYDLGKKIRLTN